MDERIVMVGAGYWSQFQVEGWRDAGAPLVAIGNRRVENASVLAQRYGVSRCYGDVAHMLDAERPTLVDVCLPPVAQEPAVRAAIERGIPTICQKPFGIDLAQAAARASVAASSSACAPATARGRRPTWTASRTSSRCPSSWCARPRCTSSTPSAS